jgi:hypothetical protein
MDAKSRSGQDIGEMEVLVVNMATQKVHYAVLAFDPIRSTPEKHYAFPLGPSSSRATVTSVSSTSTSRASRR